MGKEKKKQRRNIQTDIDHRDFHSMDRRPSSQSIASASKSERPVKKSQKPVKPKRSKTTRKPTRAQLAKKDILYDTKKFDIVDAESLAREDKRKKREKPIARIRAVSIILVCLIVFFITALIGIFIICKVDTIDVVGESVYSNDEILSAADYHIGDNLFFLPIAEVEESLPKKLPYIELVHIEREIPKKITIEVTASVPSAVFQYNENYVTVGGSGKILDISTENNTSIMQVLGVEIEEPILCESVKITDDAQNEAFYQIMSKIEALSAQGDMTELDLNDTGNILLIYQNRIKMDLGTATKLAYKVQFGLEIVQDPDKISVSEYGRLDLTLKSSDSKVIFNPEYNFSSGVQQESTEDDDKDKDEDTSESAVAEPFASNPGRGDDIPDEPYGSTSASNDDSTEGNEGSSDDSESTNEDNDEDSD